MKKISILLIITLFIYGGALEAGEISSKGEINSWVTYNDDSSDKWQPGLRYIPEIDLAHELSNGKNLDAEVSVKLSTTAPLDNLVELEENVTAKLYRGWLRYSTEQFELRAGLQKINFGSAKVLRSLMWFDSLDARDPLGLTDGVYGLLTRYYFLDNANIWVWGLYGNDDLKGIETFKTDKDKMEFGGRYQFPVSKGEMAFTYNHRFLDKDYWNSKMTEVMSGGGENRYGIDGNWDIGVGLWFEAAASEIKINSDDSGWEKFLTVGTDYTFDIGSGLHVLYEHFIKSTELEIDNQSQDTSLSAVLLDYSLNTLDTLKAIGYYDWKKEKVYSFLSWQRTYDNWLINLSLFKSAKSDTSLYSGKGIVCMVAYNY